MARPLNVPAVATSRARPPARRRRAERERAELGAMSEDERRRRLELAVPFWTYLAIIAVGLVLGVLIGLTHH